MMHFCDIIYQNEECMRKGNIAILLGICASFPALASNEGVPSYYQMPMNCPGCANTNNAYNNYTTYVSSAGVPGYRQVVGTNSYTYRVPNAQSMVPYSGMMTANGIAVPASDNRGFYAYGGYGRRFADFQFTTSVNSILEWDDMIFNELTVGGRYNFTVRNFDMVAFGEYTYGRMSSGGLSMDYDLQPYDASNPRDGIFTISMGNQSGDSHHMRFGVGARNIWDFKGWKLTPFLGYEIFKHNLQMSDHFYPNQGVYIPLMTADGDYVFGDARPDYFGVYYAVPESQAQAYADGEYYQVCVSPEQIKVASIDASGGLSVSDYVLTDVDSTLPWGVTYDECIVIGGDGPILVSGKTHEYNTTWSGFFVGLEVEKQMTLTDKLRFYGQISMPKYSSEGIWPNRTDWQQNPSFLDEGNNGSLAYSLEMEYIMTLSDRLQLSLKADTNYFHVGKIGGEIYWAAYTDYAEVPAGNNSYEIVATEYPAYTQHVADALKEATWQSFGLHLGVKYAF